MLTIHAADAVLVDRAGVRAVTVDGGTVVAMGTHEELAAAHPGARVRHWPGLLTPGLRHPRAVELLEAAYHPDPREAAELGTEPLTGEALAALGLDDVRRGGSARRGLQRLLAHGTTAVTGPFTLPPVRTAVARSGLRVREPAPGARPAPGDAPAGPNALDVLAGHPPHALEALLDRPLTVGGPADFAVFDVPVDVPPSLALGEHGARSCVATVLGGRLVHRRA